MAELKGPFQFTGSLGNLRSYYNSTLKRYILSTKGGASKELIYNNPAFARTRENMQEFKACGKWASQMRKSLDSIENLHAGYYFADIIALGKSIQKHDEVNYRGFRSIESSKASNQLLQINFNKIHPFERVFSHWFATDFSEDKRTVTLTISDFKSFFRLNWPARYSLYRFALVIAQLPDFVWKESDRAYGPVVEDMELLSKTTFSDWISRSADPRTVTLSASFTEPALQQPGTTVIVALGVEVTAASSGSATLLTRGSGTMKIVQCYV